MMVCAEVLCNLLGVGKFTVVVLLEANRERFDWLRHHRTHQPYHHARIDPATEKCAQRDLAHQTHLYRVLEQCKRALNGRRFIVPARWCEGKIPVTSGANLPIFVDQDVGSREL